MIIIAYQDMFSAVIESFDSHGWDTREKSEGKFCKASPATQPSLSVEITCDADTVAIDSPKSLDAEVRTVLSTVNIDGEVHLFWDGSEDGRAIRTQRDLLADLFNAADLDQQEFPALEHIVPGVLVEGMALIVGPPKVGKSWLVGDLALACASGGVALGRIRVDPRPVLYLSLEDGPRRLQSRLRHLSEGQPLPAALDMLTDVRPDRLHATVETWLRRHHGEKPLVILDTFGKCRRPRGRGEDAYAADYEAGSALKRLVDVEPGAGLLVVHHTRKQESDDFVDSVSGTNGLPGAADSILVLRRKRKSPDGELAITGRDVDETELALTHKVGRWRLVGDTVTAAAEALDNRADVQALGSVQVAILATVRGRRGSEITPAEVAQTVDAVDAKQAGTYLKRLAESGRIKHVRRGVYASVESEESVENAGQGMDSLSTLRPEGVESEYDSDLLSTLESEGVESENTLLPGNSTDSTLSTLSVQDSVA